MPRFLLGIVSVGLIVSGTGVVSGQDYPNKTIRIVTSAAGGDNDFVARLIAQGQLTIYDAGLVAPHVNSGKLKALAVTSSVTVPAGSRAAYGGGRGRARL